MVENAIELPKQRVLLFAQPKLSFKQMKSLYLRISMRVKGNTYKATQPPLRTIVVEQDGKFITHIYRSRDSFRLDELARYKKKVFKQMAMKYETKV